MPKTFRKKIVRPNSYNAINPLSGKRKVEEVTAERIASLHKTGNAMLEAGLKIPSPFVHKDKNGKIPQPLKDGDESSWSPEINAGYWKKFEVDEEDGSLIGYLEVPDDKVADKVSKTITETSICYLPKWTDGNGKEWDDALWHIRIGDAHSVEANQENFEAISDEYKKDNEFALAMALSMADSLDSEPSSQGKNAPALTKSIVSQLSEKLDIDLPDDTNEGNILERLNTVLTAIKSEEEDEEFTQQPKNTESPSSPVAMADENKDQELEVIEKKTNAILSFLTSQTKQSLKDRITNLLKKAVIGKRTAEQWTDKIEALAMSLDDITVKGDEVTLPDLAIAMAIDAAEENGISKLDPPNEKGTPPGTSDPDKPKDLSKGPEEDLSESDERELYANMGV